MIVKDLTNLLCLMLFLKPYFRPLKLAEFQLQILISQTPCFSYFENLVKILLADNAYQWSIQFTFTDVKFRK